MVFFIRARQAGNRGGNQHGRMNDARKSHVMTIVPFRPHGKLRNSTTIALVRSPQSSQLLASALLRRGLSGSAASSPKCVNDGPEDAAPPAASTAKRVVTSLRISRKEVFQAGPRSRFGAGSLAFPANLFRSRYSKMRSGHSLGGDQRASTALQRRVALNPESAEHSRACP